MGQLGTALRVLLLVLLPLALAFNVLAKRNRTVAGQIRGRISRRLWLALWGTRGDFTRRDRRYRHLMLARIALAALAGMASLFLGG